MVVALIAAALLVVAILGGLGLVALWKLDSWSKSNPTSKELKTGDCIDAMPVFSDLSVKKVRCGQGNASYEVIFNTNVTSSRTPTELNDQCDRDGGIPVNDVPDKKVLCLRS